jgi:hypothetical protein
MQVLLQSGKLNENWRGFSILCLAVCTLLCYRPERIFLMGFTY